MKKLMIVVMMMLVSGFVSAEYYIGIYKTFEDVNVSNNVDRTDNNTVITFTVEVPVTAYKGIEGTLLINNTNSLGAILGGYYKTSNSVRDYSGLIETGDGECGAFMNLLEIITEHQGIVSERVYISCQEDKLLFLVEKWNFKSSGSSDETGFAHVNYVKYNEEHGTPKRIADGKLEWTIIDPEVEDVEGIAGQGNGNPYKNFGSHYILKLNNK